MSKTKPSKSSEFEFSALLTPHRSLSSRGFFIFMAVISLVCLSIGGIFMLLGAWPVMGFMGLDIALIYWAFRRNYYDAKIFETIRLTPYQLILNRVYPTGHHQIWKFNPYWVQVNLQEHPSGATKMQIKSSGKSMNFGQFLSDNERREFTSVLQQEILQAKNSLQPFN